MRLLHIILLAALAGCTAPSAVNQPDPNAKKRAWDDQMSACRRSFLEDTRLDPLRTKINFGQPASLEEQSQKEFVIEAEKPALRAYDELVKKCAQGSLNVLAQINAHPAYSRVVREDEVRFSSILLELYQGRISYGEFAQKRVKNKAESGEQWNQASAIDRAAYEANAQANAQAAAQARAASDANNRALLDAGARLLNSAPQPVYTDCTRMGNNMSCISR